MGQSLGFLLEQLPARPIHQPCNCPDNPLAWLPFEDLFYGLTINVKFFLAAPCLCRERLLNSRQQGAAA